MGSQKYLYVYILKCADKSYYTGVTNNPERRLTEHNEGIDTDCYTYSRRPVKMIYTECFNDFKLAISWEKKIKKWSRRKKEALINSKWDELKKAAVCRNDISHKSFISSSHISTPLDVTTSNTSTNVNVSWSEVENKINL